MIVTSEEFKKFEKFETNEIDIWPPFYRYSVSKTLLMYFIVFIFIEQIPFYLQQNKCMKKEAEEWGQRVRVH